MVVTSVWSSGQSGLHWMIEFLLNFCCMNILHVNMIVPTDQNINIYRMSFILVGKMFTLRETGIITDLCRSWQANVVVQCGTIAMESKCIALQYDRV